MAVTLDTDQRRALRGELAWQANGLRRPWPDRRASDRGGTVDAYRRIGGLIDMMDMIGGADAPTDATGDAMPVTAGQGIAEFAGSIAADLADAFRTGELDLTDAELDAIAVLRAIGVR